MCSLLHMDTTNTANKVTINGVIYRIADSAIPAQKSEALRAAFRAHGIADHVNALAPRSRNRYEQLFVMTDGTAQVADSRIVQQVARAAAGF